MPSISTFVLDQTLSSSPLAHSSVFRTQSFPSYLLIDKPTRLLFLRCGCLWFWLSIYPRRRLFRLVIRDWKDFQTSYLYTNKYNKPLCLYAGWRPRIDLSCYLRLVPIGPTLHRRCPGRPAISFLVRLDTDSHRATGFCVVILVHSSSGMRMMWPAQL